MSTLKFKIMPAVLTFLMLAMAGGSAHAYLMKPSTYRAMSISRARSIALKEHSGRVVSEVVGHTRNGDKAYRFFIRNRRGTYAVGVDAVNGRVVEDMKTGPRRVERRGSSGLHRLFAPVHWG